MTSRMIILAGAPETAKLDWSEKSLLPDSAHVESLPNNKDSSTPHTPLSPSSKAFGAQWRQITTQKLQMRPILPKLNIDARQTGPPSVFPHQGGLQKEPNETDRTGAEFFSFSELLGVSTPSSDISEAQSQPSLSGGSSSIPDTTSNSTGAFNTSEGGPLSEYYDHSFSIYEAIPSSQLSHFSDSITPGTPIFESNEEMFSPQVPGTPGGIIRTPSQRRLSQAPRPKTLSELHDIPNARYLETISPQTMTVNLIVGIISIAPPRTVITGAKYGRPKEVDLVEMVVGDDTKSGFPISLWLPKEMRVNWKDGANANPEGSRSILRRSLRFMKPRDVVLLQNVALSSFRGKVHGQSLKGDVTKIDLLFRKKVDDDDLSGIYSVSNLRTANVGKDPQVLKVKQVKDWLMEFVGEREGGGLALPGGKRGRKNKAGYGYAFLPEDTP